MHFPEIMYQYTVYFYDILETESANTEFISRHSRDRMYEMNTRFISSSCGGVSSVKECGKREETTENLLRYN